MKACDSGILQMKAMPQMPNACFAYPPTRNSIKAICGTALRVQVKGDRVTITPLEQGTYKTQVVGRKPTDFHCQNYNASGRFYSGSTTSASMTLYDDIEQGSSNLTKTGPTQISLTPSRGYIVFSEPLPNCTYKYTVVEGCVFGIKAPAAKPACPKGFYSKAGRCSKTYCAPCLPGTYTARPGGPCKRCPVGTSNRYLGASKCPKCLPGQYAAKPGKVRCDECGLNSWSDGKRCYPCSKGSVIAADNPRQCIKCQAGARCCTANWNAACPKCAKGKFANSYSSIFALESAAPSSCLATGPALCFPKIKITVDSTCQISLANFGNPNTDCSWSGNAIVRGPKLSIKDIASFGLYNLADGNLKFTTAAAPYLNAYIPATKCALRYRALTSPLAAILGAAPKPTKATSCPAGQYLEAKTDAKPGPCLPCPPGTYSPGASKRTACIRCAAGTYTDRYCSTKCKRCSGPTVSKPGAASCSFCDQGYFPVGDRKTCKQCPANSDTSQSRGAGGRCLENASGNVCCAAGDCKGQTPCTSAPKPFAVAVETVTYTAVLQLASKSLPQPACKNATFLSCLPTNGKIQLYSYSDSILNLYMEPYKTALECGSSTPSYLGHFLGTKSAYLSAFDSDLQASTAYGLVSSATQRTVTAYLTPYTTNTDYIPQVPPKTTPACSATFTLLAGHVFDLSPPTSSDSPPAK